MILIIERDIRKHDNNKKPWKLLRFSGTWNDKKTWRIGIFNWSLSYYPEPGLRDFLKTIGSKKMQWYGK